MPKRLLLVLAVAALAIAACHSGSTTPSPSSSPASPSPNPSITKAAVLVTVLGTPQPHVPVQESTPKNTSSPRPGTPFDTEYTNKKGVAHFFN
jgi:ABC-type glycerol-3-phosphate transport system substrate-binding protein